MSALIILINRHAERLDDAQLGPGLTALDAVDPKSLVIRG